MSLGDSEKASEAAEAAIRVLPDAQESFYYVAAAYARCVPRLEKNPKLNEAQRRALVRSVGDRAVESTANRHKERLRRDGQSAPR